MRVEENPAPAEARGRAQQADSAAQGGAGANAAQDTRADERARATARTQLPRTASSMPTVLLLGLLAMTLGLSLSLWPRSRA